MYDILDMTDEEIDNYIEINETDLHIDKRGRAYKRLQRRNKIEKRTKQMNNIKFMSIDNDDIRYIKQFAKMHDGCRNARCGICHYSKKYKLPTKRDIMEKTIMKDQLKELME